MKTNNKFFKRILFYASLGVLTVGASLILGFLSFTGMYAIFPMLCLSFISLGLSVSYEGEIYMQNIKGALKKLFKSNYLEGCLAKEYLLINLQKKHQDLPMFFADYSKQLELLGLFGRGNLDKASKKKKKTAKKTLKYMEKWFIAQLFSAQIQSTSYESDYVKLLQSWLEKNGKKEWQERLRSRSLKFNLIKGFSILAGLFMGIGTTYLIVGAFSVIPFLVAISFSFWPIIILLIAIIAGIAYGMLTLNAITDLLNNNTLLKLYHKLHNDLKQGLTVRNITMTLMAIILITLAIALTICTAGTWWTITNNVAPLFSWVRKIPSFLMGIINPIITGSSAIFFIFQNTAESLNMVDKGLGWIEKNLKKGALFKRLYKSIAQALKHLRKNENWLQIINPFRIFLKLTIAPLRILLFFGHLISIAVTADRMPGIPQIVAAILAIISEGFEDAHYFIGREHNHGANTEKHHHGENTKEHHKHEHNHCFETLLEERLDSGAGHKHSVDIPTFILKTIAIPIYYLAATWDYIASQLNPSNDAQYASISPEPETHKPRVLDFRAAWNKQRGNQAEIAVEPSAITEYPSQKWRAEHAVFLIEQYQAKHLKKVYFGQKMATSKISELDTLKVKLKGSEDDVAIERILDNEKNTPIYNENRLFAGRRKTDTQIFIETLPTRVSMNHTQ